MENTDFFQQRFRFLVSESHYTQKQIAQLCGITEASLSRYMNGERLPKPGILANLATALHTTTDYLLGNDKNNVADYEAIKVLLLTNRQRMSDVQKKELSDILLENENIL